MRRRIWSETLPYSRIAAPATLARLRRHELELMVAVRPPDLAELASLVTACAKAGVPLALWPMLDDARGRWANVHNAREFVDYARGVLARAGDAGPNAVRELVIDLEPPIADVAALFSRVPHAGRPRVPWASARVFANAREVYAALVDELGARGVAVSATLVPLLLFDGETDTVGGFEFALGTPLAGVRWATVHAMLYSSIVEGWSGGLLGRQDVGALLARACTTLRARYGPRASVSLGAVGIGALGDEPVYRTPGELAQDAAWAQACGLRDLALFDLGGVLARADEGDWLAAFTTPPAMSTAPPRATVRSRIALGAGVALGRALGVLARGVEAVSQSRAAGTRWRA